MHIFSNIVIPLCNIIQRNISDQIHELGECVEVNQFLKFAQLRLLTHIYTLLKNGIALSQQCPFSRASLPLEYRVPVLLFQCPIDGNIDGWPATGAKVSFQFWLSSFVSRVNTLWSLAKYIRLYSTVWGRNKMAEMFGCIFANENLRISIQILLQFDRNSANGNMSALVNSNCYLSPSNHLIQRWPRSMMPYDVTRSQWVNTGIS